MKKLTALLLGTVIGIAFTASDAFAENPVMKYLKSDDGNTGLYLGVTYNEGSLDDVRANYNFNGDADNTADSTWALEDGKGGKLHVGYDFGKIRINWQMGALESEVLTIDGAALEGNTSDDAVLAYTTINVGLDLYRFELINRDFVNVAITPYVGGGWGYGGGWMTGKKNQDAAGANTKRDNAGHGSAYSYEAGALLNLTDWAGVTLGWTQLHLEIDDVETDTDLVEVGVRFTF